MNEPLRHALAYHERGWSVIPVRGKTPATAWAEYQSRAATKAEIRHWFAAGAGDLPNLAIVTGKLSGLVVVDCDSPEDATWWENHFPPTSLTVRTGGGGQHFYYRYPDRNVGNRTRVLDRQIDLRGEGGLVVAPPSIHPESGNAYCWIDSLDPDVVLPFFDSGWIEPPDRSTRSGPRALRYRKRHRPRRIRSAVAYIRRIEAIAGQGGHNATFRAACRLRDAGLTPEQAFDALSDWNETNADPAWTEKELLHKIEDAYAVM